MFKVVPLVSNLRCVKHSKVVGLEDIAELRERRLLIFSSDDRINGDRGSLYIKSSDSDELILATENFKEDFHPHGIDARTFNSRSYVLVVNHVSSRTTLEKFELKDNNLVHLKTYQGEHFKNANDVVLLDEEKFFISIDHGQGSKIKQRLEDYTHVGEGKLLLYDQGQIKTLREGFSFANGLAYDFDRGFLVLAEMLRQSLNVFHFENNELTNVNQIELKSSPDNLSLDEDGVLWVAAHPKLALLKLQSWGLPVGSPSQIYQVQGWGNKDVKVELMYSNKGLSYSSASVAVKFDNHYYIGSIYDKGYLKCK